MRTRACAISLVLTASGLCGCAASGPGDPPETVTLKPVPAAASGASMHATRDFAEGRQRYHALVSRQVRDTRPARQYWQRAHDQDPSNPTAKAFLGATIMMAADLEGWLPKKGQLAGQGLQLLDAAVAADPDDVEIRFLRGMSTFSLPGLFRRGGTTAEDLAIVASRGRDAVAAGQLEPAYAAAGAYHYGLLREKAGDSPAARTAWRTAIDVAPESNSGRAAARRLAAMRSR